MLIKFKNNLKGKMYRDFLLRIKYISIQGARNRLVPKIENCICISFLEGNCFNILIDSKHDKMEILFPIEEYIKNLNYGNCGCQDISVYR